jgi:hypothetical protein
VVGNLFFHILYLYYGLYGMDGVPGNSEAAKKENGIPI